MNLLFQLYKDKTKREFKKSSLISFVYLLSVYFFLCGFSFYLTLSTDDWTTIRSMGLSRYFMSIIALMCLPDFIFKLVMKRDQTAMDDYISTRPFNQREWCWLLVVANLFNPWNWLYPILYTPFILAFMPIGPSLLYLLFAVTLSMVNGVFITAIRKSSHSYLFVAVVHGWMLYTLFITILSLFPWGGYLTVSMAVYFLLAALCVATLHAFMCHIKNYAGSKLPSVKSHSWFRSSSLFGLTFMPSLRSPFIRKYLLLMFVIFFLNDLQYTFLNSAGYNVVFTMCIYVFINAQFGMGIEENYLEGLATKPISMEKYFTKKYYSYVLSVVILAIPVALLFIVSDTFDWWQFSAMLIYACGAIPLVTLVSSIYPTPVMDLYGKMGLFQSRSKKFNFRSLVVFVPFILYAAGEYLLSEVVLPIVSAVVGIAFLLPHRHAIRWMASSYRRNKYKFMEEAR